VLVTCTVKEVDDGLSRTSVGRAGSAFSITLYVDWLNITLITIEAIMYVNDKQIAYPQ